MRPNPDPQRPDHRARNLLLLAAVIGTIALVGSLLTRGATEDGSSAGGNCRLPSGASAGAPAPPPLVAQLVAPLPAPSVQFTQHRSGSVVNDYCYDLIDGDQLVRIVTTLDSTAYTRSYDRNPTQQVLYRDEGATPYGISLTVTGTLDVSRPEADQRGGLSVVWTDTKPD